MRLMARSKLSNAVRAATLLTVKNLIRSAPVPTTENEADATDSDVRLRRASDYC
jgi:hypothetical protein